MELFSYKINKEGFESVLPRSKSLKIFIFLKQYGLKPHGPCHR